MNLMELGIFVLITCVLELEGAPKKVVFLMPRHVKRAQGLPWRQFVRPPYMKSPQYRDNDFLSGHHSPKVMIPVHQKVKNMPHLTKQVPHGGDDYDQGHEEVNHVIIPHGKGITHAISFGRGYVPQEALMHHAGFSSDQRDSADDSVNYNTLTPVYITSQAAQQADAYFQNNDNDQYQDEIQDRKIDDIHMKFLKAKAIAGINPQVSGKIVVHAANGNTGQEHGGSNENKAIILRDNLNFEEYNKKIAELTKNWPVSSGSQASALPTGSLGIISVKPEVFSQISQLPHYHQLQGHSTSINTANYPEATNLITSFNLNAHRGYAVKEEVQDIPHDFRTMPIQTNPIQLPVSTGLHVTQPFQSTGLHISPSFQSSLGPIPSASNAIPGFYALAGYPGVFPGFIVCLIMTACFHSVMFVSFNDLQVMQSFFNLITSLKKHIE